MSRRIDYGGFSDQPAIMEVLKRNSMNALEAMNQSLRDLTKEMKQKDQQIADLKSLNTRLAVTLGKIRIALDPPVGMIEPLFHGELKS